MMIPSFLSRRFAVATCALLAACRSDTAIQPAQNPVPVALSITPRQLEVGIAGAATITGQGFVTGSQVRWNGGDRPTRYISDTTLTFDLLGSDVQQVGTAKLTVVNPPPGGGVSGELAVVIGMPRPRIRALLPSSAILGASGVLVSIIGSGFTRSSSVQWNSTVVTPVFVNDTLLRVYADPFAHAAAAAFYAVTVSNPPQEGGTSDATTFTVENPKPAISSLSTDSAWTGIPLTLSVNGSGFTLTSTVRWNGSDRPTTVQSDMLLTIQPSAEDLASAGTAIISVVNAPPGGGTSGTAALRILESPPRITAFSPATVTAGAGAVSLTIKGAFFRQSSTLLIDGVVHPGQIQSDSIATLSLSAADVASPRLISIQVVNPGASGPSKVGTLLVLPAAPTLSVVGVVALKNNFIVYDSVRKLIYASIPSSVGSPRGNTVTQIDPATGAIGASVIVGNEPGRMAITDDARYLYVALNGAPSVVRVDLTTFTKDIEFGLGTGTFGPNYGGDLVTIPNAPRTVIVARHNTCCSSTHEGVVVYDDGVPRPVIDKQFLGPTRLAISANGTRVYGVNTESSANGVQWLTVSPSGIQHVPLSASVGVCCELRVDHGILYTSGGRVVDPDALTLLGTLPVIARDIRPDNDNGRLHQLTDGAIQTYEALSLTRIGGYSSSQLNFLNILVRFGRDGLAAGSGDRIVLLHGSLVSQ